MNNSLLKTVKSFDYISFDIYDTLIIRNVREPRDVFALIEKCSMSKFGEQALGFSKNREVVEREIRYKKADILRSNNGFEEVTLEDIYEGLERYYPSDILLFAKEKELEIERVIIEPNKEMLAIYNYCIENKKKVFIVSDMYLPISIIRDCLDSAGVHGYDKLYLSSEIGLCKSSGKLYEYILKELRITPGKWLHVGDNIISDIKKAKAFGIATYHIQRRKEKDKESSIEYYAVNSFISNSVFKLSPQKQLGFKCMGPLLFGFSQWLYKGLLTNNIQNVFFLSRDGKILKKAFDIMYADDPIIKSHYFYASRYALQKPLVYFIDDYDDFISRLHWPIKIEVKYFLKSMGIEEDNLVKEICTDNSISLTDSITRSNLKNSSVFKQLFYSAKEKNIKSSFKDYSMFLEYVKQENMCGRFAIVDIGWHGNMQRNITEILTNNGMDIESFGFYVGISPDENFKYLQSMTGYVFDVDYNTTGYEIEKEVNYLFEEIFMANHGSVKSYYYDGNKYRASFFAHEQSEEQQMILNKYQAGALEFVRKFKQYDSFLYLDGVDAIKNVLDQFTDPVLKDAKQWGRIVFKDIQTKQLIVEPKRIYKYILHPKWLISDYRNSMWKIGFLKILFKYNFNYFRIYMLLKNIRIHFLKEEIK